MLRLITSIYIHLNDHFCVVYSLEWDVFNRIIAKQLTVACSTAAADIY